MESNQFTLPYNCDTWIRLPTQFLNALLVTVSVYIGISIKVTLPSLILHFYNQKDEST